jgi:hypothetical protein
VLELGSTRSTLYVEPEEILDPVVVWRPRATGPLASHGHTSAGA